MLIIDRFEGDYAVVEYSGENETETMEIPRELVPDDAKEGAILKLVVDKNSTQKRKKEIDDLADDLFK